MYTYIYKYTLWTPSLSFFSQSRGCVRDPDHLTLLWERMTFNTTYDLHIQLSFRVLFNYPIKSPLSSSVPSRDAFKFEFDDKGFSSYQIITLPKETFNICTNISTILKVLQNLVPVNYGIFWFGQSNLLEKLSLSHIIC